MHPQHHLTALHALALLAGTFGGIALWTLALVAIAGKVNR